MAHSLDESLKNIHAAIGQWSLQNLIQGRPEIADQLFNELIPIFSSMPYPHHKYFSHICQDAKEPRDMGLARENLLISLSEEIFSANTVDSYAEHVKVVASALGLKVKSVAIDGKVSIELERNDKVPDDVFNALKSIIHLLETDYFVE